MTNSIKQASIALDKLSEELSIGRERVPAVFYSSLTRSKYEYLGELILSYCDLRRKELTAEATGEIRYPYSRLENWNDEDRKRFEVTDYLSNVDFWRNNVAMPNIEYDDASVVLGEYIYTCVMRLMYKLPLEEIESIKNSVIRHTRDIFGFCPSEAAIAEYIVNAKKCAKRNIEKMVEEIEVSDDLRMISDTAKVSLLHIFFQ